MAAPTQAILVTWRTGGSTASTRYQRHRSLRVLPLPRNSEFRGSFISDVWRRCASHHSAQSGRYLNNTCAGGQPRSAFNVPIYFDDDLLVTRRPLPPQIPQCGDTRYDEQRPFPLRAIYTGWRSAQRTASQNNTVLRSEYAVSAYYRLKSRRKSRRRNPDGSGSE